MFEGQAYMCLKGQKDEKFPHTQSTLAFADFLMIIWPQQRFGGLNEELLFINKFPVYQVVD